MSINKWKIASIFLMIVVIILLVVVASQQTRINFEEGSIYFLCTNTNDLIDIINTESDLVNKCNPELDPIKKMVHIDCAAFE